MRRVYFRRHICVRPQLFTGLVAVVCAAYGMFAGSQSLAGSNTVAHNSRPVVAGVATAGPRLPHPQVDCGVQACLAITFDDGPSPDVTPMVLNILAKHHAHATFFVVGSHVKGNEALLRRMYQEGNEIGNHSWNHPYLTKLTPEQVRAQIDTAQAAIVAAGVPAPTLLRPPYGDINSMVESMVPMTVALWNVDPEDWNHTKADEIPPLVRDHVKPGRVVLLHDTHKPTAESLDGLLTDLQKNYTLVTFSELFDLAPGQPGRYYGR